MRNLKNHIISNKYFPITDYAKILKILIGVNLAFLIALISKISPITICSSAMLVIILGNNENTSRKCSFSRIIANFIGIPIVILIFFILSKFTSLSIILKVELTLTFSLALALLLNARFKFVKQWNGIAIAVLIITLSVPKNLSYPILRITQVFIGVILGYLVNRFILPINYYNLACYKLKKISSSIFKQLETLLINNNKNFLLNDIKNDLTSLDETINYLKNDVKLKKYSNYKVSIPLIETLICLCKEALGLLETIKNINLDFRKLNKDFSIYYLKNLENIIYTHKTLLKNFVENSNIKNITNIDIKTININSKIEIILISHLFEYGYEVNKAIKTISKKEGVFNG